MAKEIKPSSFSMHGDPEDISAGDVVEDAQHDAVFGEIRQGGPNYRNARLQVGWLGTAGLMMKAQIGLGVLSFPSVFDTLGMIPGVILLCTIAGITTWSDYIVGVFKLNHRHVYGIDDAGQLLFGRVGKELFAVAFMGFLTVTIAVGVQDRPPTAPLDVAWKSDYKLFGNPTFAEAISSVSTLIFAYAGTGAFFPIVSEMRDPRMYPRALALCQTVITVVFLVVGIVVYYYCGSYVASPALGSAGTTIKKVSYGIALPGLLVSGILLAHVSSKYVFVRMLRGSDHLTSNSFTHWATWLGCTFGVCIVAYMLASSIPVFNGIVSLAGALFGTLLSFQPMGCMWLYDNWSTGKEKPTKRWRLMVCWSIFVIVSGTFLMIAGTFGAILGIVDSYKADGGTSAWSCADNSNSS
ncbi:N amino acid transport system protein [Tolypocladium ophioglossoides CBS 100239]|uniref:N amino acid transport system protein n=1 Tax=Tolypocladium ophioglossoides (strain CBS 100239) TaxID=1163406 RepID=A0A0L0N2P5_TOLOC|nr:N amino acid transport system protein [Tolypocladium ophioglossoides CBS 100239]